MSQAQTKHIGSGGVLVWQKSEIEYFVMAITSAEVIVRHTVPFGLGHTGEMMFQKFITVFIVTAAIAFAASGLPLSSIFGAGSGSGFFNLPLIF